MAGVTYLLFTGIPEGLVDSIKVVGVAHLLATGTPRGWWTVSVVNVTHLLVTGTPEGLVGTAPVPLACTPRMLGPPPPGISTGTTFTCTWSPCRTPGGRNSSEEQLQHGVHIVKIINSRNYNSSSTVKILQGDCSGCEHHIILTVQNAT